MRKTLFLAALLAAASLTAACLTATGGLASLRDTQSDRVLAAARRAHCPGECRNTGVLILKGTEAVAGLSGPWRLAQDLASGRMHETVDFGVFQFGSVWDGAVRWRQDHSGGVHALNSDFAKSNAITAMWLARRGFLQADADGARLEYLRPLANEGQSYEILRATPANGQPVELWFDAKTGLLARSVWLMQIDTFTIRYEDYHPVGGTLVPYRIVNKEGDGDDDVVTVDRASIDKRPSSDEFKAPATPNDSTVANGVATVPIEYDGFVVISAMINGKGPFGFILDTGGHDILSVEAAKALGLKTVGAGESGGAGAGTVSEQYTRVERVDIGGVMLRDQSFFVDALQFDTVERGSRPPLAGIMGVELFERFAMELNYHAGTLTFRPLVDAKPGHGIAVPIRFSDDQPLFTAKIDGIAGDNGLDTGNAGALVIQGKWAQNHGLAERMRLGLLTAGFGAGGMSQVWAVRSDIEVAGITFPRIVASYSEDQKGSFSSRTEAGNIGNQIYSHFTLSFDYRRGIVWFDPVGDAEDTRFVYNRAGLAVFKETADAFTVAVVMPHGPAEAAGLKAGDRILAVDGVAAHQLSGMDVRRLVRRDPGTKMTLSVMHDGKVRTAIVTLRELLP